MMSRSLEQMQLDVAHMVSVAYDGLMDYLPDGSAGPPIDVASEFTQQANVVHQAGPGEAYPAYVRTRVAFYRLVYYAVEEYGDGSDKVHNLLHLTARIV